MNDFIMGTVYGEIWQRPALDKRSRSLCMVAVAIGMPEAQQNLRLHIRGALESGLTREEILEVIMNIYFYTHFLFLPYYGISHINS
ncbi:carboxymuconolactone decarboxylase family protein [Chloroflexota bacterium]